jgi:LysM repeat protein
MKNFTSNSCAKGCLIYVVALVAIVAATGWGLGGLRGRFGTEMPQGTFQPQSLPPGDVTSGGILPTPTPQPPLPTLALPPQSLPTIVARPTLPPGSSGPGTPIQFTPIPGQGGVISGEASPPFYVVQSGDTLWEIALRFGVDVDTLLRINNLTDDIIVPGQVLYLPQPQQPQQPQPAPTFSLNLPPVPQGDGSALPSPVVPNMPNTGIIKR